MSSKSKNNLTIKLLKEIVAEYIANIEKVQIESEQFISFIRNNKNLNNDDLYKIIDNLISSHKQLFILSHKFRAEFYNFEKELLLMSSDSLTHIMRGLDIHLDILEHTQERMERVIKEHSKLNSPKN